MVGSERRTRERLRAARAVCAVVRPTRVLRCGRATCRSVRCGCSTWARKRSSSRSSPLLCGGWVAMHLNLWKKHLGHVPDSVWERTDLETLVLADNELSELSRQIGRLKKLRMLDLGHNKLTQVPDTLADLDSLTDFLYLHDNRLNSLPPSLDKLTKLRYLNISENAFEVF